MSLIGDPLGEADCEAIGNAPWAQPISTLSSLAFVVASLFLVVLWRRSRSLSSASALYAGALALVGVGSIAYHGPQWAWVEVAHDLAIVGVATLAVVTPVVRRLRGGAAFPGASAGAVAVVITGAGVAVVCYWLGRTDGPACDPDSLWQWHAAWHVAVAAVLTAYGTLLWPLRAGDDQRGRP